MQPISHDRLQAFLTRNQKLIANQIQPIQLEHKHSNESNSNSSHSDTRGKTDSSKDKGRSVSPIHTRELSNINSDQRNSDSFLSSDKDLQPFINAKPSTPVNLLPEIDYLYSYATNNNTTLKSPTKASMVFFDKDNFSREEYHSAQKSPFKREPVDLFDFRSNPVEVGSSSRSVSPRNNQKEFLTNRLEAYLQNKKKFQERLKENYSKEIVKSSNKAQSIKSPKSSADNSMISKVFKKDKSPSKNTLFSVAVPNYAKPTKSKSNNDVKGCSPDFPRVNSRSITPKSGQLRKGVDSSNSSSRSKLLERTPTKRDLSLSKSKSAILKSPSSKSLDKRLKKDVSKKKLPDNGDDDKNNMLFSKSSKKLKEIDQNLDKDSIYKNEIKTLIKTIKEEKEQVSKDLLTMAAQMSKYKHKYKKLKKQLKEKKNNSDEQNEDKSENTEDIKPQKRFEEALYKKSDDISIFTVDDLKTSKKTPKSIEKPTIRNDELLVKCETLNKNVESIMNGLKFEYHSGSGSENGQIELPKTPEISYIIKDMGLDYGVFFSDSSTLDKNSSEPGLIDMNLASRKIIQFLYEKLAYEQYQRLRTEEQANDMIISMQKTISQLEEKRIPIRK